jgi:hypothetical protein
MIYNDNRKTKINCYSGLEAAFGTALARASKASADACDHPFVHSAGTAGREVICRMWNDQHDRMQQWAIALRPIVWFESRGILPISDWLALRSRMTGLVIKMGGRNGL